MKLARILFGCCLSYTSANSAISAISGINSGEFRIYIIYNTRDGVFVGSGSDQACCVCVRPSPVPGGMRVISVLQCGPIVSTSFERVLIVEDCVLLLKWMQMGSQGTSSG